MTSIRMAAGAACVAAIALAASPVEARSLCDGVMSKQLTDAHGCIIELNLRLKKLERTIERLDRQRDRTGDARPIAPQERESHALLKVDPRIDTTGEWTRQLCESGSIPCDRGGALPHWLDSLRLREPR